MQNILKGSRALVGLLLLVAIFAFGQAVQVAAESEGNGGNGSGNYSIDGTATPSGLIVEVTGQAAANPYTGQDHDQHVSIDWNEDNSSSADNKPSSWETVLNINASGGSFASTTWSGSHPYPAAGPYKIFVRVHHAQAGGAESGSGEVEFTVNLSYQCSDGIDNDGDELIDENDPACLIDDVYHPELDDESNNPVDNNDAPVTADDNHTTDEDTVLNVSAPGVLDNDTDLDVGDSLTAVLVSGPSNGALTLNGDGSFDYTPNANFHGTDSFTYVANDGTENSNEATVTITVNPVNDAPDATNVNVSTQVDTPLDITFVGSDVDTEDVLTFATTTSPSHGTLSIIAGDQVTYTPETGYTGPDSFQYQAEDNSLVNPTNLHSAPATVNITVTAGEPDPNNAPVAVDDTYSVNEDSVLTVSSTTLGVLGNDNDIDGDTLTASVSTTTQNGILSLNADGTFTYTPNADFNGSDSFTYVASDGLGGEASATATITVDEPEVPACSDDSDNDEDGKTDSEDPGCWIDPNDSETYDENGTSEEDPADLCTNLNGFQTEVPANHTEENGICTEIPANNGGGGGSGGGGNGPIIPNGGGIVLGASTEGEVLGDSCGLYMDKFLRFGSAYNDSDQVSKLQTFLNKWMNSGLNVTGTYGLDSVAAVNAFQTKYADQILAPWGISEPTGIVYQTTLRQINLLECPALSLGIPSLVAWSENPNLPRESFGRAVAAAVGGNAAPATETTETEGTSEITLDEENDESDQTASVVNATDDEESGFWSNLWNNLFGR